MLLFHKEPLKQDASINSLDLLKGEVEEVVDLSSHSMGGVSNPRTMKVRENSIARSDHPD